LVCSYSADNPAPVSFVILCAEFGGQLLRLALGLEIAALHFTGRRHARGHVNDPETFSFVVARHK
jgi:hypothetical protein